MLTKERMRKLIRPHLRIYGSVQNAKRVRELSWVHATINTRHVIAGLIARNSVDGAVGFNVHSMDCDCVESTYGSVIEHAYVLKVSQYIESVYEDAKGPSRYWITAPDEIVDYSSRDRVLEAFEDGHPYSV